MATKKKVTIEVTTGSDAENNQVISLSYDADTQQILDHFGENSAEYAEAKAKAEKE